MAAAIEIADAEGLDAVSMSRVAKALGFTPMSLYRHVGSKEELLLHMQDVAVGPPPAELDPAPDAGWRECVERWAWATVRRMRAHPWILQTVPMPGPPATPNQPTWLEYGLRALRPTPLAEPEKLYVILMLNAHTFGDLTFHEAETADTPESATRRSSPGSSTPRASPPCSRRSPRVPSRRARTRPRTATPSSGSGWTGSSTASHG